MNQCEGRSSARGDRRIGCSSDFGSVAGKQAAAGSLTGSWAEAGSSGNYSASCSEAEGCKLGRRTEVVDGRPGFEDGSLDSVEGTVEGLG